MPTGLNHISADSSNPVTPRTNYRRYFSFLIDEAMLFGVISHYPEKGCSRTGGRTLMNHHPQSPLVGPVDIVIVLFSLGNAVGKKYDPIYSLAS